MSSRVNKLNIASGILKDIELFDNCEAIAIVQYTYPPESFKFIEELLMHNYRVSIYNMNMVGKPSYLVDIRHVGFFQIM